MRSLTSSQPSTSMEKKPPILLSPPAPLIKTLAMDTAQWQSKIVPSDQIATPERPIQLPRLARNGNLVFSVKEVKKIAMGLRSPSTDRVDVARYDDDLLSVEEQLISSSGSNPVAKPSKARSPFKLPEKYEILSEFFNCMVSSIRLLRLKGLMSTFSNICGSIQHLTDRRFSYGHLAQLKFILPEAILFKKVLLRDEATCCMKPELQVSLRIDATGKKMKRRDDSGYSTLRKAFRLRIEDFSQHPEGDDIQEAVLPYPFNQRKPNIPSDTARVSSSSEPSMNTVPQHQLDVASHMPRSFQRRFSQKTPIPEAVKTPLMIFNKVSPIKSTSKPRTSMRSLFVSPFPSSSSSTHRVHEEENKDMMNIDSSSQEGIKILEGTPEKLSSTPARLMTITPEIQAPKRYRPTTVYDTPPPEESVKRSARTKLFRTPRKSEKLVDPENKIGSTQVVVVDDDDDINFLPKTLLQAIREKERKALEEKEAGVANAKRRQKMISSLPKLFDMILLIFQSGNRSTITKQELTHKIVSCFWSVDDKYEVDEQLKLLLELAPDWISKKRAFGDFLYCINKSSSPQEVRRRLAEAE